MTRIQQSEATRLTSDSESDALAGAVFTDPVAEKEAKLAEARRTNSYLSKYERRFHAGDETLPHYRTITLSEMATLPSTADIIYGNDPDVIVRQLEARFRSPPGTTRVCLRQTYKEANGRYDSRVGRWVIVDEPLISVDPNNAEVEVSAWVNSIGKPVLVNTQELPDHLRSEDTWRELGFAVRSRAPGLFLLSYKPADLERRKVRKKFESEKSVYDDLVRGYFGYDDLKNLRETFRCVQWPWPKAADYDGIDQDYLDPPLERLIEIARTDADAYAPWPTHEARMSKRERPYRSEDPNEAIKQAGILAEEILTLHGLARKLTGCEANWWRKPVTGTTEHLTNELAALVPYLYGVEQRLKHETETATRRKRFDSDEKLCKWIRRECKHFGIAIPPPPVPPKEVKSRRVKKEAVSPS